MGEQDDVYLKILMGSSYFEPIIEQQHIEARLKRLLQESRLAKKEAGELVCEYGSKSNTIFIVIEGKMDIYVPRSQGEVNERFRVIVDREREERKQRQIEEADSYENNDRRRSQRKRATLDFAVTPMQQQQQQQPKKELIDHSVMKKVGEAKQGQSFGEIGAILDKPRAATVITTLPSKYLVVSYQIYQTIFSPEQISELNFRVYNLKTIFSHKSIGTDVIAMMAIHFYPIPNRTTIYREGDRNDGIYLVQRGHLEVFRTERAFFNNKIPITTLGKGSLVGIEDYILQETTTSPTTTPQERNQAQNAYTNSNATTTIPKTRGYHVRSRDLVTKIYKLDLHILDDIIRSYPSFSAVFLDLATKKQKNFANIFTLNIHLKNQLLDKSKQPSLPDPSQSTTTSTQPNESEGLESSPSKRGIIPQTGSTAPFAFPPLIRYENSAKVRDFPQTYEMNIKRLKRVSSNQREVLTYENRREVYQNKSCHTSFKDHYESQKRSFVSPYFSNNQPGENLSNEDNDDGREFFPVTIDEIASENKMKSQRYIQSISLKSSKQLTLQQQQQQQQLQLPTQIQDQIEESYQSHLGNVLHSNASQRDIQQQRKMNSKNNSSTTDIFLPVNTSRNVHSRSRKLTYSQSSRQISQQSIELSQEIIPSRQLIDPADNLQQQAQIPQQSPNRTPRQFAYYHSQKKLNQANQTNSNLDMTSLKCIPSQMNNTSISAATPSAGSVKKFLSPSASASSGISLDKFKKYLHPSSFQALNSSDSSSIFRIPQKKQQMPIAATITEHQAVVTEEVIDELLTTPRSINEHRLKKPTFLLLPMVNQQQNNRIEMKKHFGGNKKYPSNDSSQSACSQSTLFSIPQQQSQSQLLTKKSNQPIDQAKRLFLTKQAKKSTNYLAAIFSAKFNNIQQ